MPETPAQLPFTEVQTLEPCSKIEPEVTMSPPANVEVADIPLTLISVPKVEEADVKRFPVMSTV